MSKTRTRGEILYLSQTPICCYLQAPATGNISSSEFVGSCCVGNISCYHTVTIGGLPSLVPSDDPSVNQNGMGLAQEPDDCSCVADLIMERSEKEENNQKRKGKETKNNRGKKANEAFATLGEYGVMC